MSAVWPRPAFIPKRATSTRKKGHGAASTLKHPRGRPVAIRAIELGLQRLERVLTGTMTCATVHGGVWCRLVRPSSGRRGQEGSVP